MKERICQESRWYMVWEGVPGAWGGAGQASEKIKSAIYKGDSRLGRRRGAWFLENGTAFNVAFEALIGRSR